MAHKKAGGSTSNGRDSNPQYRGVKKYGGEFLTAGSIIVRQVGTHIHAGLNTRRARDHSIYALIDGVVKFERLGKWKKRVSVYPSAAIA